jgi:uncharacterized protein with GYD domain
MAGSSSNVYVTLYRYTDQGARAIRNAVELAQRWHQEAERRGVKVLALYWLQGQYDALTILEGPDEDEVMALLLAIGAEGSLRTETVRGYSIDDLARMLGKLPA